MASRDEVSFLLKSGTPSSPSCCACSFSSTSALQQAQTLNLQTNSPSNARVPNHPKVLRLPSSRATHPPTEGFSAPVAFAFTINMIVGAGRPPVLFQKFNPPSSGVLGLPYAYYHAGIVLSTLFLLLITLICAVTMGYLIDVCARAHAYVDTDSEV